MAKRTRGVTPTSAYRPGQAPVRKSGPSTTSKPVTAQAPSSIDSAIALSEGTTVAATAAAPAAPAAPVARTPVASHQRGHVKVKPNSLLAARASQEYTYVGEDLRHITKVALGMLVVMILLYLVIVVGNIFHLY